MPASISSSIWSSERPTSWALASKASGTGPPRRPWGSAAVPFGRLRRIGGHGLGHGGIGHLPHLVGAAAPSHHRQDQREGAAGFGGLFGVGHGGFASGGAIEIRTDQDSNCRGSTPLGR